MKKPSGAVGGLLSLVLDFSPLVAFYLANWLWGLRAAVAASVAVAVLEFIRLKRKGEAISVFLKFSFGITLVFGILDLTLQTPVFFRYEASLTNVLTGIFFGATLLTDKPILTEFAERRARAKGTPLPPDPHNIIRRFFQVSTIVWTMYFFVKAAIYVWIARHYSIEEALAMRAVIGNISLYALIGLNILLARPIIRAMYRYHAR